MANAFVNFMRDLDANGAQAFVAVASQPHQAEGAVGTVDAPTAITLVADTEYFEIKPTSGNIFLCVLPAAADQAARVAARVRIDQGEKTTMATIGNGLTGYKLFIWAV